MTKYIRARRVFLSPEILIIQGELTTSIIGKKDSTLFKKPMQLSEIACAETVPLSFGRPRVLKVRAQTPPLRIRGAMKERFYYFKEQNFVRCGVKIRNPIKEIKITRMHKKIHRHFLI